MPRGTRSLSVLCPTNEPGSRVCAGLQPLRAIADEIVVAVEASSDPSQVARYAEVADRVLRIEPGGMQSSLPWLHAQCNGDWILALNGDEVCGPDLVAALPELTAARDALQHSFTLRWVWPDPQHWLRGPPWHPDFHVRLMRNDATLRFVGRRLEFARRAYPHRFSDVPLWYLGLLTHDADERRARASRTWSERPGLSSSERGELNPAFYVPEDMPIAAQVEELGSHDHQAIWHVLAASPLTVSSGGAEPAAPPLGSIETLAAEHEVGPDAFAATLTPLTEGEVRLRPGEQHSVYVRVRNDGDELWPWGTDHPPPFRIGYRWYRRGRAESTEPEGRSILPCDIAPGEQRIVAIDLTAPVAPGRWELEVDMLLDGVRWFGTPCWIAARVD
jgi:hypothetical protein